MTPTEDYILQNIIAIRNKKGFSQDYLATQLGISQSGYNHIEKGGRRFTVAMLLRIAIVFEMHVIDIILYPSAYTGSSTEEEVKATLTVELKKDKKDQVLKLVFGDNNLEILNK